MGGGGRGTAGGGGGGGGGRGGGGQCFFFQAEDGIRDLTVTGVQTCALPILGRAPEGHHRVADVLVESAMVLENQAGHVRKILVQEIREILSVQFFGNGREAANIAEHHGNVGFLWFYKTRIDEQPADDFGA